MRSTLKQYDVWLADLNPRFGTEPGKTRPVLIIQTDFLNAAEHPSTIICPISTNVIPKSSLLRIHLEIGESGNTQVSDVLVDQIRAIDNKRFVKKLGSLSEANRKVIKQSLKIILDL